jgi:hypothetical protein
MEITYESLNLDGIWYNERWWTCLKVLFEWLFPFYGPFEYGDGGIFKLLRWMQNLRRSTWGHEILHVDRFSEDEQLLITSLLRESKNANVAGGWTLKFTFYFVEKTHEPLHLRHTKLCTTLKIMDTPTGFIWIIISFDRPFEYSGISIFWGYVGTDVELRCLEFCNFVQCRIFVSHLSSCCKIWYNCLNWYDNGWILKAL